MEGEKAWDLTTGDPNVVVGIMDNGTFDLTHPDLASEFVNTIDPFTGNSFVACGSSKTTAHSTWVSGSCSGETTSLGDIPNGDHFSIGFNTKMLAVHFAGGRTAKISKVMELTMGLGIPIITIQLWLNRTASTGSNLKAIQEILDSGAIIIGSGGNTPGGMAEGPLFPFNGIEDPRIITVTSHGADGNITKEGNVPASAPNVTHSLYPEVDISAPGYAVFTTSPQLDCAGSNQFEYKHIWGTSIAAPITAGVVSLMLSVNPDLCNESVQTILKLTAVPNPDIDYYPGIAGAGRINAYEAVKMAKEAGQDLTITQNETWDSDRVVANVIVQSGYTLTIDPNVTVLFAPNSKLVIEQGAELELYGTLTSAKCGKSAWQGVVVDGDGSSSQDYINGYVHGHFQGKPGSKIENARIAINLNGDNGSGGIVKCDQTTFLNNQVGVKFLPFTNTSFFSGQPAPYNASFRNCDFLIDENYFIEEPFFAFAHLWGVDRIPFAGCHFINSGDIQNPVAISNFGFGILSIRSGFSLVSSVERPSYVRGLGRGVHVATYGAVKPYYISQTTFEDCYIGVSGYNSSFGTIVNDSFLLGTVPDPFFGEQSGIYLEGYQIGLDIQENTFLSNVQNGNTSSTLGIVANNLGDMNNVIRRNIFQGDLFAGNNAYNINSVPASSLLPRGLYYLCNTNLIDNDRGFDFFVPEDPPSAIRRLQNDFNQFGLPIATGNTFSRTTHPSLGDFNASLGQDYDLIDYYCLNDAATSDVEIPYNYFGIDQILYVDENTCTVQYCIPPCITQNDLPGIKSTISTYETQLQTSIANQDTIGAVYYRNQLDDLIGDVAEFYHYDTVSYSEDSLMHWYRNMSSITGQLLVTGVLIDNSDYQNATSTLNAIGSSYQLTPGQVLGIDDLLTIYNLLSVSKADSLSASDMSTLTAIALKDTSLAAAHANAILDLNGIHHDPVYYIATSAPRVAIRPAGNPVNQQIPGYVAIYPNPTSDVLYISVSGMSSDKTYVFEMFDLQGRLITSLKLSSTVTQLDLRQRQLVSSVYGYRVSENDQTIAFGKIVID
jgi:subtilase family protein/type IX secretion system substrate protein